MKIKNNLRLKRKIAWVALITLIILIVSYISYAVYIRYIGILPDFFINVLPEMQIPQKGDTLIVFSPHPDDETLACAGLIEKSIKNEAKVYVVVITDGNKHGLKNKRYEEVSRATGDLGLPKENLIFLDYPDGKLSRQNGTNVRSSLTEKIKELIDGYNPNFVAYPLSSDKHSDHSISGRIIKESLANRPIKKLEYLVHYQYFPRPQGNLYWRHLLPPAQIFDQNWEKLSLNQDEENLKRNAVLEYKSQLKTPFLHTLMISFIRQNEIFITNN